MSEVEVFDYTSDPSYFTLQAFLTLPERQDDLIVFLVWVIVGLYSVAANFLLSLGILRKRKFRQQTCYWPIVFASICDIFQSCANLIMTTVLVCHEFCWIGRLETQARVATAYFIPYYCSIINFAVLAANRFFMIVCPHFYERVFSSHTTWLWLGGNLALALLMASATISPCCWIQLSSTEYITEFADKANFVRLSYIPVNVVVTIVMLACYSAILYRVHKSRIRILSVASSDAAERKEILLLIQFLVISSYYVIAWTSWGWVPITWQSKWANFLVTTMLEGICAVNPTVYFVFNTALRKSIGRLFGCGRSGHRRSNAAQTLPRTSIPSSDSLRNQYE